jgi:hypothetical protein
MPAVRDVSISYNTTATWRHLSVPIPVTEANDIIVAVMSTDTGTQTSWVGSVPCKYVRYDDGTVFTNYDEQALDSTPADWYVVPATPAVNDAVYFGSDATFKEVDILFSTAGAGTWTNTIEYWNGAWTAVSGVTDGTTSFKAVNTVHAAITFTPPADWATTTINGVSTYWIRSRVSAYTSITTRPVCTQAWIVPTINPWTMLFTATNTSNLAVLWKLSAGASELAENVITYAVAETADGVFLSVRDANLPTPFTEVAYQTYASTNQDGVYNLNDTTTGVAQSFTGTGGTLSTVSFYLKKTGTPTGNAVAKLYTHSGTFGTNSVPTGAALATSNNFNVATLTDSYVLTNFNFSIPYYVLVNATNYVITLEYTGTASNTVDVGTDATGSTGTGNAATYASATWTAAGSVDLIHTVKIFTYVTSTASTAKTSLPSLTTSEINTLVLYLVAHSGAAVPSIIEGAATMLVARDGSAHSDAVSWGFKSAIGSTLATTLSTIGTAAAHQLATVGINPPKTGASIVPAYCSADASTYLTPLTGAAYNSDAATTNTITTDFGTVINGKTLVAGGTTVTRADAGLNSFHAVSGLSGVTTAGRYGGNVMRFAVGNKPNVSGKNVIIHGHPYMPIDIQTTDSVGKTGACGVVIGLCSTANSAFKVWHVGGAATPWDTALFVPFVINSSNTSGLVQTSTTASFDAASVSSIGFAVSGVAVVPDWCFCSAWSLDTTTICGGNSTEPIDIPQIVKVGAVGHERRSLIQQGSSQMLVLQPLQFGDGSSPTYLGLDATAIEFPEQYNKAKKMVNYCSIDNVAGITYYAADGDTIRHKNSVVSSASKFHWKLHTSSSTHITTTYDFGGLSVIGAGTISLARAVTITGLTINGYGTLDVSGLTLDASIIEGVPATSAQITVTTGTLIKNSSIDVTTVTAGNYWCTTTTPVIFENCTFTGSVSTGHAIRITTAGTYNFTGNKFTTFGTTGSTSSAILNESGGLVTLNILGTGDVPTYTNVSAATTTIVSGQVALTITVKDINTGSNMQDARVLVAVTDGTNFPYLASITIVSTGTTATVTHTGHGLVTGNKVEILGATQIEYNGVHSITYASSSTYTYTLSGSTTSPATGTITATMVLIDGLTDVNGEISDTRSYANNQAITGRVRRSTSPNFYKTAPISGTVSKTAGFSATVQMIPDA